MLKGYLSEFSLGELFQVLEEGHKTGRLSLSQRNSNAVNMGKDYHIWFRQGEVVAMASRLDSLGLISLIKRRSWIDENNGENLPSAESLRMPLGTFLKTKGILQATDLQLIFRIQVMREITPLFQIPNAQYEFREDSVLPLMEMTGLSINGKELILKGLRNLRDWKSLQDKLPQSTSGLVRSVSRKPDIALDLTESRLWNFTKDQLSIREIALKMSMDVVKVQQVAFRLIVIGLLEEIPFLDSKTSSQDVDLIFEADGVSSEKNCPTNDFMQSLLDFLQKTDTGI